MHRVRRPDDRMPRVSDGAQERRQGVDEALRAHSHDERQPSRPPRWIERFAELEDLICRRRRSELDSERVVHPGEELHVRAAQLPRPLADPEHVRRAVVPVAGQGVPPRQRLLVVEHEPLVARPEVDAVEALRLREIDPTGADEVERALDLGGEHLIALALGRVRHELLIPGVHLGEVGEAAVRERADEVERGRRLVVGPEEPGRVRRPRRSRRCVVVDDVAEERRQLELAHALGRLRSRLRELPGDAADLHERQAGAVDHHDRHLQKDLQLLADRDGAEVAKRLGAVAGLEQESTSLGDRAERCCEIARLACENQRRHRPQLREGGVGGGRARPGGLLADGVRAPVRRSPSGIGHVHRLERVYCAK